MSRAPRKSAGYLWASQHVDGTGSHGRREDHSMTGGREWRRGRSQTCTSRKSKFGSQSGAESEKHALEDAPGKWGGKQTNLKSGKRPASNSFNRSRQIKTQVCAACGKGKILEMLPRAVSGEGWSRKQIEVCGAENGENRKGNAEGNQRHLPSSAPPDLQRPGGRMCPERKAQGRGSLTLSHSYTKLTGDLSHLQRWDLWCDAIERGKGFWASLPHGVGQNEWRACKRAMGSGWEREWEIVESQTRIWIRDKAESLAGM